jgi:DNA polymerase I-like protein with 3'-5' exonuclease and polymerase domains
VANRWEDTHIVGFIHDEIIVEVPDDSVRQVMRAAEASFKDTTQQFKLNCPMDGSAQLGKNWSEIH